MKNYRFISLLSFFLFALSSSVTAQQNYKTILLPPALQSINQEFSGLCWHQNRLFLLPQYGNHKESLLEGAFNLYSISADSIGRVIDRKDSCLTAYQTIPVMNLNELPDSVKASYEGFEALTIVNEEVFMAIESNSSADYCYILKGRFNASKNQINIDAKNFISLKKYPYIENAGFESLSYLSKKHKLIAIFEYNALKGGGTAYLIDPKFKQSPQPIHMPFLPFRTTDVQTSNGKDLYALNYFYNSDYNSYLNNNLFRHAEERIKLEIPDLKPALEKNPKYLQEPTTSYARIIKKDSYKSKSWQQVSSFPSAKNNWEGLALYRKGALVISDANRNIRQLTTLAYFEFQ